MLNFRHKQLVHSGVGVGICEFEEVVGIKVRDFLPQPFVF